MSATSTTSPHPRSLSMQGDGRSSMGTSSAIGALGVVGFVAACAAVSVDAIGDHAYVAAVAVSFAAVFFHFRPRLNQA